MWESKLVAFTFFFEVLSDNYVCVAGLVDEIALKVSPAFTLVSRFLHTH